MSAPTEREAIARIISEAKSSFVQQVPISTAREMADRIIAEHIEPLKTRIASSGQRWEEMALKFGELSLLHASALKALAECETVLKPLAQAFEFVDDRIRGEGAKDYRGLMASITIGDLRAADALLAKLKARTKPRHE